MAFAEGYIEVHERTTQFYVDHPFGRIRSDPPRIITISGYDEKSKKEITQTFVEVHSYVYRGDEDLIAGEATSWEPYPGQTPYTRNSEAENAETSAIGRALAAAGIETKRSMSSANEVRNRQAEQLNEDELTVPLAWAENYVERATSAGLDGAVIASIVQRVTEGRTVDPKLVLESQRAALNAETKSVVERMRQDADAEGATRPVEAANGSEGPGGTPEPGSAGTEASDAADEAWKADARGADVASDEADARPRGRRR